MCVPIFLIFSILYFHVTVKLFNDNNYVNKTKYNLILQCQSIQVLKMYGSELNSITKKYKNDLNENRNK